MNIVGYFWMAIITLELALIIWTAVLRMLNIFRKVTRGFLGGGSNSNYFFAIMLFLYMLPMLIYNLMITMWLIWISAKTIRGVWSKNGITYKTYKPLYDYQQRSSFNQTAIEI
jgi:hypothetical protein